MFDQYEVAVDAVDALASTADQLAARDLDTLDDAQLRADVEALTRIIAQATAERLRCTAAVAGRAPDSAAGTQEAQRLLQTAGRLSGGQAARQTRLATALADPKLEATAAALAAGRISPAQADALAQAARTHPQLIADAQDELVEQASQTDGRVFREALADRRHAADPGPEEQRACRQYAARRVSLSELADGMGRGEMLLDPPGFAYLRTALDALAGPDPATVPDELRRTSEQRMADALVELARRALAHKDELPSVAGLQPKAPCSSPPRHWQKSPARQRPGWTGPARFVGRLRGGSRVTLMSCAARSPVTERRCGWTCAATPAPRNGWRWWSGTGLAGSRTPTASGAHGRGSGVMCIMWSFTVTAGRR